jgi:hypothetical protein
VVLQVFNAAINDLLLHRDWELWSNRLLPRFLYADEDVQMAVQQHIQWYTAIKAKRSAMAEAAAAAEAADAAAAASSAAESMLQQLPQQGLIQSLQQWLQRLFQRT